MPRTGNMKLVQEALSSKKVTYESLLDKALIGVSKSIDAMTDIVQDKGTEAKDRIAAGKTLAHILIQLAEAQVTEKLPLLEELERNVRKTA